MENQGSPNKSGFVSFPIDIDEEQKHPENLGSDCITKLSKESSVEDAPG
jgi:hypothetical protein